MQGKKIILSICIPTYNRANALEDVLKRITSDSAFDNEVELIVSDNCSTDNTRDVVKKFENEFPNVKYFRNETNVIDRNFRIALSHGNGEYLKLINDYIYFPKDALQQMKECIKKHLADRIPIFFTEKVRKNIRQQNPIFCNSLDEYIYAVSYFVTWISNFGCWREDFVSLKDKERCTSLCLLQVDWTYRIVAEKKKCIIYTHKLLERTPLSLGSRSGYNFLGVHVHNYYKIMQSFVDKGDISRKTLLNDKKYTVRRYRSRMMKSLIFRGKNFDFDLQNSFSTLWNHYKSYPKFYIFLLIYFILRPLVLLWRGLSYPFKKISFCKKHFA